MKKITLSVDSKHIPLNRFVTQFLIRTIEGMISSLRGIKPHYRKIEIQIEEDASEKEIRREEV